MNKLRKTDMQGVPGVTGYLVFHGTGNGTSSLYTFPFGYCLAWYAYNINLKNNNF